MSTKYKVSADVPTSVISARLEELSDAVTRGYTTPFAMRVPAELDYCPDLVMSEAALRLINFEKQNNELKEALVYVAHASHKTPLHMLPNNLMLSE